MGASGQFSGTLSHWFHSFALRVNSSASLVTWCSSRYPSTSQPGMSPSSSTGATGPCSSRISPYTPKGLVWKPGPLSGRAPRWAGQPGGGVAEVAAAFSDDGAGLAVIDEVLVHEWT